MMNCKQAVRMLSSEEQLSWPRKVELRLHLLMCQHCSKYAKQLELLKSGFKTLFDEDQDPLDSDKAKELKYKILSKVK